MKGSMHLIALLKINNEIVKYRFFSTSTKSSIDYDEEVLKHSICNLFPLKGIRVFGIELDTATNKIVANCGEFKRYPALHLDLNYIQNKEAITVIMKELNSNNKPKTYLVCDYLGRCRLFTPSLLYKYSMIGSISNMAAHKTKLDNISFRAINGEILTRSISKEKPLSDGSLKDILNENNEVRTLSSTYLVEDNINKNKVEKEKEKIKPKVVVGDLRFATATESIFYNRENLTFEKLKEFYDENKLRYEYKEMNGRRVLIIRDLYYINDKTTFKIPINIDRLIFKLDLDNNFTLDKLIIGNNFNAVDSEESFKIDTKYKFKINDLEIQNNVTEINNLKLNIYNNFYGINRILIPSSVEYIRNTEIDLSGRSLYARYTNIKEIENSFNNTIIEKIALSNKTERIMNSFNNCYNLYDMYITNCLEITSSFNINDTNIYTDDKLNELDINDTTIRYIADSFNGRTRLKDVKLPTSLEFLIKSFTGNKVNLNKLPINLSVWVGPNKAVLDTDYIDNCTKLRKIENVEFDCLQLNKINNLDLSIINCTIGYLAVSKDIKDKLINISIKETKIFKKVLVKPTVNSMSNINKNEMSKVIYDIRHTNEEFNIDFILNYFSENLSTMNIADSIPKEFDNMMIQKVSMKGFEYSIEEYKSVNDRTVTYAKYNDKIYKLDTVMIKWLLILAADLYGFKNSKFTFGMPLTNKVALSSRSTGDKNSKSEHKAVLELDYSDGLIWLCDKNNVEETITRRISFNSFKDINIFLHDLADTIDNDNTTYTKYKYINDFLSYLFNNNRNTISYEILTHKREINSEETKLFIALSLCNEFKNNREEIYQ